MPEADLDTHLGDGPDLGSSTTRSVQARPLERGEAVGRYVVLERLGVGGMGEVYAAYDPELDRKIAIKLLLPSQGGDSSMSTGPGRLLREAQAMAKLGHPNVVTVHDVGMHDIRVFVAMEYVDGGNLADWIEAAPEGRPHPWRLVLERFLAAGEGLAAAHAAGLIHRDFKPANVLVGRDGAIRVADFGLARRAVLEPESGTASPPAMPKADEIVSDATLPAATLGSSGRLSLGLSSLALGSSRSSIDSLSMRMTVTGATLGTPAYMAPEQYGHNDVDARADQFSYCVALWEALYGERPFVGDNLHALMFAIAQGRLREPSANSDVPAWIRRALARGLTYSAARRWPDMRALLAELRNDPSEKRRKLALLGVGLALVGGLTWGALAMRPEPEVTEQPCTGSAEAFGDALSTDRREAVVAAFGDFEQQWARDVGDRLLPRLDAWAQDWQAAWTDTCEATHVRNEQSAELLDRRMSCLDRQRQGFVAVVDALSKADEEIARGANEMLAELDLEHCNDTEALLRITPLPDDPAAVEAIEKADAVLANARGLYLQGHYAPAMVLLESQRTIVEKLAHDPLSATFEQLRGRLAMTLDDPKGGEKAHELAFNLALRSGDDKRAAKVARSLALELKDQERIDEALRWLGIAEALVERVDDHVQRGEIELTRSQALAGGGDLVGSEASAKLAYELLTKAEADSGLIGDSLYLLGMTAHRAGRYDETIERLEQAREAWSTEVGPRHPRTAAALNLLGITARSKGQYAQSQAYLAEALEIANGQYGVGHIQTTDAMMNLAVVYADQGKFDEAITRTQQVLEIRKAQPEPIAMGLGRTYVNLAQLQRQAGRIEEAYANVVEGEAIIREALKPDHPDLVTVLHIYAMTEFDRGEFEAADRRMDEAMRIAAIHYPADHPRMVEMRFDEAKIALARGQVREAERVLGPPPAADADPAWIGEYEFVWAKIQFELGRKEEARAAAERAKQGFAKVGPGGDRHIADIEAWLREHG